MDAAGNVDPFLEEIAVQNSVQSTLQRNEIYRSGVLDTERRRLVDELIKQLRQRANCYRHPVGEVEHCATIRRICEDISRLCGPSLKDGRFRYGTAQKAFNLYLKFLWKLGGAAIPPHCPIDGIVLQKAKINAAWTKSDDEAEYLNWIETIKPKQKGKACLLPAGKIRFGWIRRPE
jgi:hypothetical protein